MIFDTDDCGALGRWYAAVQSAECGWIEKAQHHIAWVFGHNKFDSNMTKATKASKISKKDTSKTVKKKAAAVKKKAAAAAVKKKPAHVTPQKMKVQVAIGQSVTVSLESVLISVDTTETSLLRKHTSSLAFENWVQGQTQG